ncbi:hypothetical protein [Streptomyces sp. NPDC055692]|uniref:hypothetical protein n=1 Tax=Streptomyces sp. NPDC055692 TaxID=3155683 RepID=UPI00341A2E94
MDTLRDVSETLSERPNLVGGELWFRLPGDGGQGVELCLRGFLVELCLVDPLGDDGAAPTSPPPYAMQPATGTDL